MIESLTAEFPVNALCLALDVPRSGYYQWRKRVPGKRAQANGQLLEHIEKSYNQSRQSYGSPRITQELRRQNMGCGKNRVARLMKEHNIRAKGKRPFRPRMEPKSPALRRCAERCG